MEDFIDQAKAFGLCDVGKGNYLEVLGTFLLAGSMLVNMHQCEVKLREDNQVGIYLLGVV